MKAFVSRILLFSITFLVACSPESKPLLESQVAGAKWIEVGAGGNRLDVLAYPLVEDELVYFEAILPRLEKVALDQRDLWSEISSAEDPVSAALQNEYWDEAGVLGTDVIAASLKLTFLAEFASAEQGMEVDMRENLNWLEQRLKGADAKPELFEAADSIRMILGVISIHRESGTFVYYAQNQERLDAALDRFAAIGEQ